MTVHQHGPHCPPNCTREADVDHRTETGAYRIVARKGYGNRPKHDKPWWWPFVWKAYTVAWQVASLIGLAWAAKKLGLTVAPP